MKYFKSDEFTNFSLMNTELLEKLDALRDYIGASIIITSSSGGHHVEGSQHYLGRAVDVIIKSQLSLFDQYLIIERFNFNGIGFYPDWSYEGRKIGGFHLDVREIEGNQGNRWIGRASLNGGQEYLPMIASNILNY